MRVDHKPNLGGAGRVKPAVLDEICVHDRVETAQEQRVSSPGPSRAGYGENFHVQKVVDAVVHMIIHVVVVPILY